MTGLRERMLRRQMPSQLDGITCGPSTCLLATGLPTYHFVLTLCLLAQDAPILGKPPPRSSIRRPVASEINSSMTMRLSLDSATLHCSPPERTHLRKNCTTAEMMPSAPPTMAMTNPAFFHDH